MPTDPKADVRAAVLAGSMSVMSVATIEPTALHRRQSAPVIRPADGHLPPLDLQIEPFRYRATPDSVEVDHSVARPLRPRLGGGAGSFLDSPAQRRPPPTWICSMAHRGHGRRG